MPDNGSRAFGKRRDRGRSGADANSTSPQQLREALNNRNPLVGLCRGKDGNILPVLLIEHPSLYRPLSSRGARGLYRLES